MENTNKPTVFFWVFGIIALLWNAMGVNAYLQQAFKTDAFKAMYTEEQLEMILNTPMWATAAFAIAVFGGLLGCILLLFRKKLAQPVFLLSLIGIVIQMIYNLFISKSIEVYGPGAIVMPIMILGIGFFLYFYTKKCIAKGWLN